MADRVTKNDTALYLYGITQKPIGEGVPSPGVDGIAPVEALRFDGVVSWISRVDRVEFADKLPRNMENLEWLAAASVRHQRVVADIASLATVLPARFGTVFLSEQSLSEHVKRSKRGFASTFKRIKDADEWGVKVFAVAKPNAVEVEATSGTDYLQKKAALREAKRTSPDPAVEEFAQALGRIAEGVAPAGKVSSGQRELLWQASFLVRRSRLKQWRQVLARYSDRWQERRRIESTGPWPPYSFVSTHGR